MVIQMPRKCAVPGCKSNYYSELKINRTHVSTFSFPKDNTRKEAWLRAIPRKHWTPSTHSSICIKHFHERDIIKVQKWKNSKGELHELHLDYPKLCDNAVPQIFENVPSNLSKIKLSKRKSPHSRPSESATQNTIQGNSSHSEQLHIKEEPLEADPSDYRLYQQLRNSIKTEPDNSETDSANSEIEKHIHSISTDKEHFVNVKKEYSDSCENEISVNHETEQIPMFESVFVKEEPFEEDCSL